MNNRFTNFEELKAHIQIEFDKRSERLADRAQTSDKEAAVLFSLIIPQDISTQSGGYLDKIYLLLEKRSEVLKKNPGDMAFPGGTVENDDENLFQTASREANEEVGVNPKHLEFISYMDEFVSSSGIVVRSVLCWLTLDIPEENFRKTVQDLYSPKTEESEVSVVIPLSHFLNPRHYSSTEYTRSNNGRRIGYVRYFDIDTYLEETVIWGLTASMIRRFLDVVFPDNLLPVEPV